MSEDIMGKKTGLAFGAGKAGYLPLRKSLAERAYDILEEAIITLGLAPGSIVSEQELSELTGIGRTPTREAIQRLSRDRLIQVLPKRGLMVSPLDLVGQLNLLELRREVEGLVCRSAARRATLDQRVRFSSIAVDFRSCIVSNDQINFARLDKEFGELCLEAAQNEYAEAAMRPILGLARRSWHYHQRRGASMSEMALLHAVLADRIVSGDEDLTDAALTNLLDYVERYAKSTLNVPLSRKRPIAQNDAQQEPARVKVVVA